MHRILYSILLCLALGACSSAKVLLKEDAGQPSESKRVLLMPVDLELAHLQSSIPQVLEDVHDCFAMVSTTT